MKCQHDLPAVSKPTIARLSASRWRAIDRRGGVEERRTGFRRRHRALASHVRQTARLFIALGGGAYAATGRFAARTA
jgi:hypothetical protein